MGTRFRAYLAGRIATEPTLGTTRDGRAWTMFRLAVDDRLRSAETGECETAQTIFYDVAAFGRLAECIFGTMHVGDAVIAHGEFRFRSYEDAAGTSRLGASFVASRIGPGPAARRRDRGTGSGATLGGGTTRPGAPGRAALVTGTIGTGRAPTGAVVRG
ncbi:MAG: single-stranded DNA-binding protein [Acidimicrobiales bacterium]